MPLRETYFTYFQVNFVTYINLLFQSNVQKYRRYFVKHRQHPTIGQAGLGRCELWAITAGTSSAENRRYVTDFSAAIWKQLRHNYSGKLLRDLAYYRLSKHAQLKLKGSGDAAWSINMSGSWRSPWQMTPGGADSGCGSIRV